jgi:hypothetical protein
MQSFLEYCTVIISYSLDKFLTDSRAFAAARESSITAGYEQISQGFQLLIELTVYHTTILNSLELVYKDCKLSGYVKLNTAEYQQTFLIFNDSSLSE